MIAKVKIVEVGPRDGLQNEDTILDATIKAEFINRLSTTGLTDIEIGSFVSPVWIPQMADTNKVVSLLNTKSAVHQVKYSVLVPNLKGLEGILHHSTVTKLDTIAVFTAASESFCQKNINCTISESIKRFEPVIKASLENKINVRGYISCVLGCPYENKVSIKKIVEISKKLYELGCSEISLGDTIGSGTITGVKELIRNVSEVIPLNKIAVHFHDTYGQALVNVYTALEMGVEIIDAAVAGLGGCPYAKGASGNLATEDLVYMLNGLDIKTDIDLDKLIAAGHYICKKLNIIPRSKISLQTFDIV